MIHLLIPFYVDVNEERQKELKDSVIYNLNNKCFSSVTLFCEKTEHNRTQAIIAPHSVVHKKLAVVLPHRARYDDLISMANNYNDVVVMANADIYFDETVGITEQLEKDSVLCLTRAERKPNNEGLYWPEAETGFCQDAWVFRPPLKIKADFEFGRLGCENRFAGECYLAGYKLFNPCRIIHAIHNHASRIRNYKINGPQEVGPPYQHVHVTAEWPIKPKPVVQTEPQKAPVRDTEYIKEAVLAQLSGLWINRTPEAVMQDADKKVSAMYDMAEKIEREATRRGL